MSEVVEEQAVNEVEAQQEQSSDQQLIPISDIDQFAYLVTAWHEKQVSTLQHLLQIPEGAELSIGTEDERVVLTGDAHKSFKLGVELSLSYFSNLPFVPVMDDEAFSNLPFVPVMDDEAESAESAN